MGVRRRDERPRRDHLEDREFDTGSSPVKLALYKRKALATDAGVDQTGDGSHRLRVIADATFTDPDGFEWLAAEPAG